VLPGFKQADGEGPWRVAVVFDDIDGMPAEFGDVGENMALEFIVADALGFGHDLSPCPTWLRVEFYYRVGGKRVE
jgi:hypothetical protein